MVHDKKEIVVTGKSHLLDIQKAFSCFYPFLSIEAFPKYLYSMPKPAQSRPSQMIASLQTPFIIDVSGQRTVAEVVQDVSILLGMKLQICRKSGNVWNAVSITDGWTLERQNAAGEYISGIMGTSEE